MSDVHSAPSASDPTADLLVTTTLNSFDARLKQLEKSEEKTGLAWVQKRLSFVALAIGILLSCLSLYDSFWRSRGKPCSGKWRNSTSP